MIQVYISPNKTVAWKGMADVSSRSRLWLVQRGKLDVPYLRRWAAELGVTDLLEKLLSALDQTKE